MQYLEASSQEMVSTQDMLPSTLQLPLRSTLKSAISLTTGQEMNPRWRQICKLSLLPTRILIS